MFAVLLKSGEVRELPDGITGVVEGEDLVVYASTGAAVAQFPRLDVLMFGYDPAALRLFDGRTDADVIGAKRRAVIRAQARSMHDRRLR